MGLLYLYNVRIGRTMAVGSTNHLTEMSTRNISWESKGGRCVGLTTLPLLCAYCHSIWQPKPLGALSACPGLHRNFLPLPLLYLHNRVFNLKVDRQLSLEYFTSDAIYNCAAGMTLYYYMCRSWQDCCRRGENRTWPSVSV